LFLVPGIYGDVFDVRTLALTLRSRRPLYGLARGLDPAQPRHSRIEAMADYYIDHLVLRQPAGPYAITGFSFGGLVAFEIARRLREQGEQVDFLGLIDTDVHPGCLTRWCRRWFRATWRARRVRELVSHPRTELLPFAQRRGSRFIPGLSSPPLPDEELLPVRRWLAEDAWEAFDAYRPRPYDGSATLFRATRRRARHCDPLPVWRSVVGGGLSVREISGEHPRLVLPPHVGELANALAAQLPDVNG
jgi:thioesterase domain-containing protein